MTLNKNRWWNHKVMAAFAVLFALTPMLVLIPSQPALAATTFVWTDKNTITETNGSSTTTFTYDAASSSGSNRQFDGPSGSGCGGKAPNITVGSNVGKGTFQDSRSGPAQGMCTYPSSNITIGDTQNASKAPGTGDNGNGNGDGSGNDSAGCESGSATLGWILCPIVQGISNAADGIYDKFIQPMLQTNPLSLSPGNPEFKAWSEFRILGDIFLVLAVLVIVFSETIGGGSLDAYTIKKVIPRLLIAVITINLSYYIVAFAVDITNIIGGGIINLIEGPFKSTGTFHLKLTAGGTDILGIGAAVGVSYAAASGLPFITWLWVFVLVPLLLTMVAILVTVIVRAGAIIFLVIVSPVAFALYCLPNTEQYFRKWWDLLFRTLLVYPIIAALFGIANVLAVTIGQSGLGSGHITGAVASVVSVFALVMPLFLIPFSFRMAGGAIGKLHETAHAFGKRGHEMYKGNPNDQLSRQNRARTALSDRNIMNRERGVSAVKSMQKSDNRFVRGIGRHGPMRWGAAALNSGDLEARRSELTKKQAELRELKTGYGPDDSVRAFFAEKDSNGMWRSTVDPSKTFSDLDVKKAQSLYGGSAGMSAAQAAVNYELGKTANDDQYENLMQSAPNALRRQGFSEDEIGGIMKGVGYANQAKRLDLKHSSFKRGEDGRWRQNVDHAAFAQDASENFGSYPISNMKTSPIKQLIDSYDAADNAMKEEDSIRATGRLTNGRQVLDDNRRPITDVEKAVAQSYKNYGFKADPAVPGGSEAISARQKADRTKKDVTSTAVTLDSRMQLDPSYSGQVPTGETEDHQPVYADGRTGAPGRVNDAIQELVRHVNPPRTNGGRGRGGGNAGGGNQNSNGGGTPPPSGGGVGGGPTPPRPTPWTPPRIIRPGDDGFNIPPGSRPPGR